MIIFGIISSIIGFMVLSIYLFQIYGIVGFWAMMIPTIGLLIVLAITYTGKQSVLNRPKILLNEIMDKKKTEVDKIRDEWFRGGNMSKDELKVWKWARNAALLFGIVVMGIATIFMILGESYIIPKFIEAAKFVGTFGLGIFTLGIAAHSITIGLESDKKMQSIATADFYEITYRFWDRAPTLYRSRDSAVRDTCSWQLGNLFRHGKKLKKWAEPEVQEQFIKEFKVFLERLRSTSCSKYWVEIKNYITTCKIAIEFETENDDMKNGLIDELSNWIGRKEDEESNQKYLQRKGNEFSGMNNYDVFEMNNN